MMDISQPNEYRRIALDELLKKTFSDFFAKLMDTFSIFEEQSSQKDAPNFEEQPSQKDDPKDIEA